jgi:hypothetical protein
MRDDAGTALVAARNSFPMSPLSSLGHVNREFVARYGPALQSLPQRGGTVLCASEIGDAPEGDIGRLKEGAPTLRSAAARRFGGLEPLELPGPDRAAPYAFLIRPAFPSFRGKVPLTVPRRKELKPPARKYLILLGLRIVTAR